MKQIVFTQTDFKPDDLYPFTLTRKVQDIRVGILTIREKWEKALGANSVDSDIQVDKTKNAVVTIELVPVEEGYKNIRINANVLPFSSLVNAIKKLKPGQNIIANNRIIVSCIHDKMKNRLPEIHDILLSDFQLIQYPWHIFELNKAAIAFDFQIITKGRKSAPIDKTNAVSGTKNIFIEKGAVIKHCIINAEDGPVYIGKNALVMEGCCLRGSVSIGEGAVVKMGAKIYGATTIGPGCTVGGEIKNSVLFANSNKAHDGYLGDSVIGEWCNLGAGTSNSNLKNTAGNIDVHLHRQKIKAGLKCGVMMGDFSRTAINTSINTGTVIGVSANVFGSGLTPKHIPSFSWGFDGKVKYKLDSALQDANRWKAMKGKELTEAEKKVLKNIYKIY